MGGGGRGGAGEWAGWGVVGGPPPMGRMGPYGPVWANMGPCGRNCLLMSLYLLTYLTYLTHLLIKYKRKKGTKCTTPFSKQILKNMVLYHNPLSKQII